MKIVAVLVLGHLITWALQTSGPTERLWRLHPFLTDLGECDFCLGVWVFLALVSVARINLLDPYYFPVVSEVVTAIAASFGVHLARIGWSMKFGVLDLTED
ncbi:MAG: hypothetical protein GTN64_08695 [Candidatus Latescibacteria bacterium]|nr:hypothetical protein [Candidatus Latescibacterota bacterium]NIO78677.1 hypothetical protein [Candidatus Latescibacterota bacterium]